MATYIGSDDEDDYIFGTDEADRIIGKDGDDALFGGGGDDTIIGGAGQDDIFGGDDNDYLLGGAGNDAISGDAGNDTIRGGAGDDVISGGAGSDLLSGGRGKDTFVYDGANSGSDIIQDFNPSEDTLDLTGITGLTRNHLAFNATSQGVEVYSTDANINVRILLKGVTEAELTKENLLVACFVRGTAILTPAGEVPVETLAIGDLVSTLGGVERPVKWIGRRSYKRRFIGRNSEANPVLISAGALGLGVPHRDLTVSGKHAMFFDGVFVRAEDLVNGDTITRDTSLELIEYFHVELDTADVIFANGAATETFANHNSRRMFVNWREYVDLYGSEDAVQPNAAGEFERPYPLATGGDALRAVLEGLPQPEPLRRAA
jgi:hypothetical protein